MTDIAIKSVDSNQQGWERFQVTCSCGHVAFMTVEPREEANISQQYEGIYILASNGCLDCRLSPKKPDTALD